MKQLIIPIIALLFIAPGANAQAKISRHNLFDTAIVSCSISTIRVVSINFPPAQKAPYHKHPCNVVGQIISGECLVQIEGQPAVVLKAGDVFYEPANKAVVHFDNNSEKDPLQFTAFYLANGEKELTELLPAKQ